MILLLKWLNIPYEDIELNGDWVSKWADGDWVEEWEELEDD